jgi:hypothetical protein
VLKHASRRSQPASRHIDPDRPPAAAGGLTLRSQVPDLRHGPRELLDCRQLQQAGRRERTRSFDRRSRGGGRAATGRTVGAGIDLMAASATRFISHRPGPSVVRASIN